MAVKQYNYALDYIKGIACIFVVWMHCEFPGVMGIVVQAVSRFSVPLFFMVSGYFCYNLGDDERLSRRKKIKHIAIITFISSLFYFCFVLIMQFAFHNQDFNITPYKLLIWAIFNLPVVIAHQYWFLFALLYTYIFFFVIKKYIDNRLLFFLALLTFVAYYTLAQIAHLSGFHVPNYYYRNWLIEGFSFFILGYFLHEHQNIIAVKNSTLLVIIIVSTLLCLLERYLMGRDFGVNICTLPQVAALMIYAINNPNKHKGLLQKLGKKMFYVYLYPTSCRLAHCRSNLSKHWNS